MRFAREALPFVLPLVVGALLAFAAGWRWSALAVAVTALAVLLFFRIPSRDAGAIGPGVLAPANGVVTAVSTAEDPRLGPGEFHHIVTFLSVFNIHVQRAPISGRVLSSDYQPGKKVAAFREDAGDVNEHHYVVFEDANGDRVGMKQIAGLLARRVVSYAKVGDAFERGELVGIIKFSSRVDLYLPKSYDVLVKPGDKLTEGASIVARADAGAANRGNQTGEPN